MRKSAVAQTADRNSEKSLDGKWPGVPAVDRPRELPLLPVITRAQKSRGYRSKIGGCPIAYLATIPPTFLCSPRSARFSAASAVRETIRLRMSKKRAETRTINVKQTIGIRMSRTIEQNG